MSWLVDRYDKGINCILADEMGLGKTLQTISFFTHLKDVRNIPGPHLVVVPLSVLFNWMSECKKFCPTLRVIRLHTNSTAERKLQCRRLANTDDYDVCLTTYEMVKSSGTSFSLSRTHWRSVVLDEGNLYAHAHALLSQLYYNSNYYMAFILDLSSYRYDLDLALVALKDECPSFISFFHYFSHMYHLHNIKISNILIFSRISTSKNYDTINTDYKIKPIFNTTSFIAYSFLIPLFLSLYPLFPIFFLLYHCRSSY